MLKKLSKILMFSILAIFLVTGSAIATPLPWLDFGNSFIWNGNSIYTDNDENTYTTTVTYVDGTSDGLRPYPPDDPILGQLVDLYLSFDGDNTNDTFAIGGWLSAKVIIVNPTFDPVAMDPNPFVAMLDNIKFVGTELSQWWDEFSASIDPAYPYDAQLLLSFTGSSSNGDGTYIINGQGKVAPVPEPATMLLLGSGLIGLAAVGRKKFFKKS